MASSAMLGVIAAATRYIIKGVLKNELTVQKYFGTVNGLGKRARWSSDSLV